LAAIIQPKYLCIHGGLSQDFTSIDQIKSIQRPISDYNEYPFLLGILWSDPLRNASSFFPNPRNIGQIFGSAQVNEFLNLNSLELIIRGHQCVENGIEFMFDNKLVTAFSTSNYCGQDSNRSGVLIIDKNGQIGKKSSLVLKKKKENAYSSIIFANLRLK
jgi:protein phosphatase